MGIDVTAETVIERSRDAVSTYTTDPSHDPDWTDIVEANKLTDGPVGLGTQVEHPSARRRLGVLQQDHRPGDVPLGAREHPWGPRGPEGDPGVRVLGLNPIPLEAHRLR